MRRLALLSAWTLCLPLAAQAPPSPPPAPATPGAAEELAPVWTAQERAAIDVLRGLRKKERGSDAELASALAAHGEVLLPLLFDVLVSRSVPAHDAGKSQVLSEVQERVILLTLGQLDRSLVLNHVASRLALAQEPRLRLAAISSHGAVGRRNDLPALFDLALAPAEHELDRKREQVLRRAVTSILARDPKAFEQLVALRRITRPELLPTLVGAVGDARDGAGLAFLADVAYWHPDLVLDVMCQVRLVGASGVQGIDDAIRVRLRPYLDAARPGHCRAAVLALTALEDHDSIGPMIALLACEDAGLKETAHWGLCTLTGLSYSAERDTWARWHQAELAWHLRYKPREFQRLRANDPADVAGALRAILTHPLALDELRQALPELLRHRAPAARILACRALAELEAKDAAGELVATLEDADRDVVLAAHQALKELTGLDLPLDPAAWLAAIHAAPASAPL